ncbi:MAG TPA: DUF3800 domain-containing protein [Candidatus Angelobacter sp.]
MHQLAVLVLHREKGGNFAVMGCSMDESADHGSARVFSVGAFIAPHLMFWFEAERLWQNRLDKDGIEYFRSADCQSVQGSFKKLRSEPDKQALKRAEREKADSIRNDLIDIIGKCGLMGVAFGVSLADYEAVKSRGSEEKKILGDVPYHFAYQLAMTHSALMLSADTDLKFECLAFVVDEHEKYSAHSKQTYDDLKQKNPEVSAQMGSLTYLDDRRSPAVQMADLMAYEAMQKSLRWLDGIQEDRPEFKRLTKNHSVYKIEICTQAWLGDFIEVNRNKKPAISGGVSGFGWK